MSLRPLKLFLTVQTCFGYLHHLHIVGVPGWGRPRYQYQLCTSSFVLFTLISAGWSRTSWATRTSRKYPHNIYHLRNYTQVDSSYFILNSHLETIVNVVLNVPAPYIHLKDPFQTAHQDLHLLDQRYITRNDDVTFWKQHTAALGLRPQSGCQPHSLDLWQTLKADLMQ